jgi:hypothetical protein
VTVATEPTDLRPVDLHVADCRARLGRVVLLYGPKASPDNEINCLWHSVLYLSRAVESLAKEVAELRARLKESPDAAR